MYVNKAKLRELMIQQTATDKRPEGNYNEFARRLGVDVAQLHRVLTSDRIPGPKFLGRLKLFCDRNGLNFDDYIFLTQPLHASNGKKE